MFTIDLDSPAGRELVDLITNAATYKVSIAVKGAEPEGGRGYLQDAEVMLKANESMWSAPLKATSDGRGTFDPTIAPEPERITLVGPNPESCDWYPQPIATRPWWARVACTGKVEDGICVAHNVAQHIVATEEAVKAQQTCICDSDHESTACEMHPTCQGQHSDTLGPCGCVDYHMADCPTRTQYADTYSDAGDEQDRFYGEDY